MYLNPYVVEELFVWRMAKNCGFPSNMKGCLISVTGVGGLHIMIGTVNYG